MKTIGAVGLVSTFPILASGQEEKQSIRLTTILGDPSNHCEYQSAEIDLNGTPDEIYKATQKVLWWPNGNDQGVFHSLSMKTMMKVAPGIVKPGRMGIPLRVKEFVDTKKLWEFEVPLKDNNVLRFNRFWVEIFSKEICDLVKGNLVSLRR